MSLLRYDRSMSASMSGNFLVFEKKTLKMLKDFDMVGECNAADFTGSISMKRALQGRLSIIFNIRQVFQLQVEIYLLINFIMKNGVLCLYSLLLQNIFLFLKKGLRDLAS